MRTIHVYRAARKYFVDGIYWGDDAEGVRFYLQVTGVPSDEITKALEQVAQEGASMIQQGLSLAEKNKGLGTDNPWSARLPGTPGTPGCLPVK